jgi:hypothetical protein
LLLHFLHFLKNFMYHVDRWFFWSTHVVFILISTNNSKSLTTYSNSLFGFIYLLIYLLTIANTGFPIFFASIIYWNLECDIIQLWGEQCHHTLPSPMFVCPLWYTWILNYSEILATHKFSDIAEIRINAILFFWFWISSKISIFFEF